MIHLFHRNYQLDWEFNQYVVSATPRLGVYSSSSSLGNSQYSLCISVTQVTFYLVNSRLLCGQRSTFYMVNSNLYVVYFLLLMR